jgi:hypothetical protein
MVKCKLDDLDLTANGNVMSIRERYSPKLGNVQISRAEILTKWLSRHGRKTWTLDGWMDETTSGLDDLRKLENLLAADKLLILETDDWVAFCKAASRLKTLPAGELRRLYSFDLVEIQAWGRSIVNSGHEAYIYDLDFKHKAKDILSPLWGRYNFSLDRAAKKFVWELILVNEVEETSSFNPQWDDDQVLNAFWTAAGWGTGSLAIPTLADDTGVVKRGNNSLKIDVGSGTYAAWQIYHDYVPTVDWSPYDFLSFWWYGQNSGGNLRVWIYTPDAASGYYWDIREDWLGWRRVVIPLSNPTSYWGTPGDLTSVARIGIGSEASENPAFGGTRYLDRGGVDVGNWVKLEVQVPDSLNASINNVKLYAWNPVTNAYATRFVEANATDIGGGTLAGNYLYFLDGTTQTNILSKPYLGIEVFKQGKRGETKYVAVGEAAGNNITYTQTYGCKYRVGFRIKMPPWTGVDDLTGKFAINKAKLKIEVYYDKEDTTLID